MMGFHCFTEQKQFIRSLLPVLIENHIALWCQSLPGKMKDTVTVYQVKGDPCIHPTNIYKARITCWHSYRHWDTTVCKADQVPDLAQKSNQSWGIREWTSHYFSFIYSKAILFHKSTGY